MEILKYIAIAVGLAGVTVITWGTIKSFLEFLYLEYKDLTGADVCKKREYLRHHLSSYLLLGLEFLIAADIINTALNPSLRELATLGSIVAIRTVLSYFLNREMADRHECREK